MSVAFAGLVFVAKTGFVVWPVSEGMLQYKLGVVHPFFVLGKLLFRVRS